jgi:hypothetical protein
MRIDDVRRVDQNVLADISEKTATDDGTQSLDGYPIILFWAPELYIERGGFFERSGVTFPAG